MFVCWTIPKSLYNEIFAIWISAGSFLLSRSSLWALSNFVRKKQTFMPHLICLFILSIEWDGKLWKSIALNSKCDKTSDLKRFIRAFKGIWLRTKKIDLIAKAILLITLLSCFWYVNSLSRITPRYLHSSVGFNEWLLNSTQLTVGNFSFLKTIISVFPSFRVNLFCLIDCSLSINIFLAFAFKHC